MLIKINLTKFVHFVTFRVTKSLAVFLVFILAFTIRAGIVLYLEPNRPIESDGKYYFETAVNLANGYGYTWDGKSPFFFREPGVIYFYAGCIKVFLYYNKINILKKSESYCNQYMWKYKEEESRQAIRYIRIIQALLQSLTILLFFFIIKKNVNYKISLITYGILAIFPPFYFHVFSILREILVAFLLILFAYIWSLYLNKNKTLIMFPLGIIWGLSSLTFQVYIFLGGIIIIYLLFQNSKSILYNIRQITLLIIGFIITVTPWLIKVYNYYPDFRIIKTLGISMTHEQNVFIAALSKCDNPKAREKYCCNFFQDDCEMDYRHIIWYQETSKIHFFKSFSGTYVKEASELSSLTSKKSKTEYFISDLKTKIKQSFFRFGTENLVWIHFKSFVWWKIAFYFIGLLSLLGFLSNFKKFLPFSLIYIFHIGLFYIIGSEARRMLPIQPFMIFFFIVSIISLYNKLKLNWITI